MGRIDYYVEIVDSLGSGTVEKRMGPFSERKADKVEDGVNINLNHERYYTRIVEEPVEEKDEQRSK